MNNITFTSNIRPVSKFEFNNIVSSYGSKNHVGYPWTIKESVCSNKAYTRDIADCTVCGITDGMKVLLMHLCPTEKINFDFKKVINLVKEKFNLQSPDLQGIIIGGKPPYTHGADSYKLFNLFEDFLSSYQIPFSKFKGGMATRDVAYSSVNDEWIIANDSFSLNNNQPIQKAMEDCYEEVKIADCDDLCWF